MKRSTIEPGEYSGATGRWFNAETAEYWREEMDRTGSNRVSRHTGGQWSHQQLAKTRCGAWLLGSWTHFSGSTGTAWEEISERSAAAWLIRNGSELPDALAEEGASLEA